MVGLKFIAYSICKWPVSVAMCVSERRYPSTGMWREYTLTAAGHLVMITCTVYSGSFFLIFLTVATFVTTYTAF